MADRIDMPPGRTRPGALINFALVVIILAMLVAAFLYFDKRHAISTAILSLGLTGYVLAVILMALFYMTPIPSEWLLVLYLRIYDVYLGVFLSWLGANLSSLIIYFIAKSFGPKLLARIVSPKYFANVDNWVKRKGALGLFIARLLPVPAFAVNYVAAVMPSIRFWPYLWTAALSIVPYYVTTALVFLGVSRGTWSWLILGAVAVAVFWGGGWVLNRRQL